MPVYEYEHKGKGCALGKAFEWEQPISEEPMNICPRCRRPIKRLVSSPYINTPKSNTELKDLGFTKLVKRDKGVYENVTAKGKQDRLLDLARTDRSSKTKD